MTMDDIQAMTGDWITPATAASAMKMNTGRLIEYAKSGQLPFPVQISGNRVKISRKGFLATYGYGDPEKTEPDHLAEIVKELHQQNVALMSMSVMLMALLKTLRPDLSDMDKTIEGVMKQ